MNVILQNELRNDPLQLGYSALMPDCPGLVAEKINTKSRDIVRTRFVTARTILFELGAVQGAVVMDALQAASAGVPALRWILPMMTVHRGEESGVDIGAAETRGMVDQLAQAGVLTTEQAEALKGLAIQRSSRAEELGLPLVSVVDVMEAW